MQSDQALTIVSVFPAPGATHSAHDATAVLDTNIMSKIVSQMTTSYPAGAVVRR